MPLTWRNYLKTKTRQPAFLWRMVIWILAVGVVTGYAAQLILQPSPPEELKPSGASEAWDHIEQLAREGQWWDVWWQVRGEIYADISLVGPLFLATFAGCCWLVFLLQTMHIQGWPDWRLWSALAAIGLGALSIWPTGFFIIWQEVAWGLVDSQQLGPGLKYNILGVGLREEFAKLLCLLPLMPLLVRQRDELAALILSACVGLGFAIEENISYFTAELGTSTMGRFLTANPMHMAATGLVGLAVYRAFLYPRDWGPHAVAVFGVIVFVHGIYDAMIVLPALAEYSIVGTIVFALLIYQFFHELRESRSAKSDTISLSATFLGGVSLLTAVTFVYLSATLGCGVAFDMLAGGVLGLAVMVYLFLREMPETIVTV